MRILSVNSKKDLKILRGKVPAFNFKKENLKELKTFIKTMRETMTEVSGIGLSANQLGVSKRLFIAELPSLGEKAEKFYAIINPVIAKNSEEKSLMEEGCLSIPNTFCLVERPEKIVIEGLSPQGKKVKVKAWGLLGRVFQHETDHLNGILITDKAKSVRKAAKGSPGTKGLQIG